MLAFLLLLLSLLQDVPTTEEALAREARLSAWCGAWLDAALADAPGVAGGDPGADVPARSRRTTRTVPSGVTEEVAFHGPAEADGRDTGFAAFAARFRGAARTIKLLEHGPDAARFRVHLTAPGGADGAIVELRATCPGPDGGAAAPASWTFRWTRPLGGRFVDVTADLLRDDPASAASLALGVDELRERLDPRLGVPLVGHVAGLAAGDLDEDGRVDLVLAAPGGVANRALVARGDGRAVDRAPELGLDVLDATRGVLLADLTGTGATDVLLGLGDELVGFERDLDGVFEVAARFPADAATSFAAADVDRDGFLDVYVCGYANPYEGGSVPLPYHDAHNGVPNVLWRGTGGWRFEDATARSGLDANNRRFSFAASFADFDQDGDPDLYVANDFGRNNLYRNDGAEGFRDVADALGVEDVAAGMGVSWGDVDLDGDEDLHVANMFSSAGHRVSFAAGFREGTGDDERALFRRHAAGNSLFVNDAGGFEERARELGVDVGWWAWGARLCDVDTDGALDVAVPAGMVTREDPGDL